MSKRIRIVIVGGGFAGLNAGKTLARAHPKDAEIEITLIDRHNHHLFQPLLYQVAMAALSPADIAFPIRSVFRKRKNVRVMLAEVRQIDFAKKEVHATGESEPKTLGYDYLVLACGARHSYFGNSQWEDFAPGLKTLEQATEIRRRVLLAYEEAESESDATKQKEWQTFVVIGGGATGVELAGALAEISRKTLSRDFRNIDPRRTRVILIEAGPRVLAAFSPELSARAAHDLEQMGVQIWTSSRVSEVTAQGVRLGDEQVRAKTVIWAAGVKPSSLNQCLKDLLGAETDHAGRVKVGADLSLASLGHPEIFVLGDQAHVIDSKSNQPLPGLAPVAIQEGRATGKNILASIQGRDRKPFVYVDKGTMATIGKRRAVADVRGFQFGGFLAWLGWLVIHIYFLVGFKNRILVLLQWGWNYFTSRRGARLIVSKEWKSESK